MAIGDLSSDEAAYVDRVAGGLGLERNVVVAWVGCESGWGTTKANHNYLNVGPGRSYPSTQVAANDAITVARQDNMRIGGATGPAQVASIIASPWAAGHYSDGCLELSYQQLSGNSPLTNPSTIGPSSPLGGLPNPADIPSAIGDLVGNLGNILLTVALSTVFAGVGLVLILMGIRRLTANSPTRQSLEDGLNVAGTVAALA